MTSITDKLGSKVVVKTLDGEKIYTFQRLNTFDNQRVYFTTVQTLFTAIAGMAGNGDGQLDMSRLADAIRLLSFDEFHGLAKKLLRGCHIKPDPENLQKIVSVGDLDQCEYFAEFPEELYLAVYHALKVNYPKSFSRLASKLGAFGQRVGGQLANQLGTVSTEQQSQSEQ